MSRHATSLPPLPPGLTVRRPRPDDVAAAAVVEREADLALYDETNVSEQDLRDQWRQLRFDLERDAWLVCDAGGAVVAHACVEDYAAQGGVDGQFAILPAYQTADLDDYLFALVWDRARELAAQAPPAVRPTLGMWCGRADARRRDFYIAHAFAPTRVFHRMKIDLTQKPVVPEPPQGITIRTFDRARDAHAVHEAIEAAFAEHFRPTPRTFEEWETFDLDSEATDLSLWRIAWAGGQVIGEVSPMLEPYGGYVDDLAVLKPWRGRGVGRTLLLHAFAVLWEAGAREVYLGVDSDNATGATQIYEGAGMRVVRETDFYEKDLLPAAGGSRSAGDGV